MLPLSHADPKWGSSSGCPAFMGGVPPVLYRLLVPARHAKIYAEVKIIGGRAYFHQFLWKLQNPISAPKCPITEPKICMWSLLLSNISYHTHSLQIRGHPRLLARLQKNRPKCDGEGGGVREGGSGAGKPAAPLIASGGGGGEGERHTCPCDWLHSICMQFSLPSLFLVSLFCCRSLSRLKKARMEPNNNQPEQRDYSVMKKFILSVG